jgi:MATE family multidrug resistance protein
MSFVGNEMGQLNISNAKRYSIAGLIIFLITTAIIVGFLAIFHNAWADFYTTNPNVKVILVDVLPWMILGLILIDGLQGTINGALKGIEK